MNGQHVQVRTHVAQKAHTCSSCGDEICAGEKYVRVTRLVDRKIEVHKIHHFENPCETNPNRSTAQKDKELL